MAKKEMEGAADVMPVDDIVEQQPKVEEPNPEPKPEEHAKEYAGGKFKSDADLEKAYLDLENKLSAQGAELGMTRKQLEELSKAQPEVKNEQPAQTDEVTQFEQELKDIAKRVDDGEIDPGEGVKLSSVITAKIVQAKAQKQIDSVLTKAQESFQKTLAERDQQAIVDKFRQDNPEFDKMKESGVLDKYKTENPLHDDFSAFFAAKADAALAQGKAEQAKIQAGSEGTKAVAADPGTAMQTSKTKPSGEAAIKDSMLAAWGD